MSTTEPIDRGIATLAEPWDDLETTPLRSGPRLATAIVPKSSIAGSSLIAVVAIMTFLAGLTCGAVTMIVGAASDWRSDVGREVTIQVRPATGRNMEADVSKAAEVARAASGIADVRVFTKDESARLVEPWLGNGLQLDELPIPRMIVVRLRSGAAPQSTVARVRLTVRREASAVTTAISTICPKMAR